MKFEAEGLEEILKKLSQLPIEEEVENRVLNKAANVTKKKSLKKRRLILKI